MYVGGYEAHLYCDRQNDDHDWDEFPHVITGHTDGECKRKARKRRWLIKRNGDTLCPLCSGKKK